MADDTTKRAAALISVGVLLLTAVTAGDAFAAEEHVKRPVAPASVPGASAVGRSRAHRIAQVARPLTIRRRGAGVPVDVMGGPGFDDSYFVRQHSWNDPRLYYFGPFRTGGQSFYGDVAGSPITRGNAGLGQISGYGGARGGFGGPHFDAVGGFHNGPGPDAKIDADYASGSLWRPDYGDLLPRYPSVTQRAASLSQGVVPRGVDTTPVADRGAGRRMVAEGRSTSASFEEAKARFAAPMTRNAPVEAGFANGGLPSIGMDDDTF